MTTRKEIAKLAFIKLRGEGKKDSALRLAAALLDSSCISLGLGDIDWEIQDAIEYCAGKDQKTPFCINSRGGATYYFEGEIEISEEQKEKLRVEFYD